MLRKTIILILLVNYCYAIKPVVILYDDYISHQDNYLGLGLDSLKSFKNLYKINIPIFSSKNTKEKKEALIEKMVKEQYNPVITFSYFYSQTIQKLAKNYPNTTFVTIDGNAGEGENILNINFKDEEGSFLVGAIAALKTKSNTIGFVGGMDLPSIRRFACGYIQGAKKINPKINVLVKMAGKTPLAFANPKKGAILAKEMVKNDADVVFHASDKTGDGVIKVAKEEGIYAIGVDTNQNAQAPGTVLTSMIKRIDIAVFKVLLDSLNNQLSTKNLRLGLKEEAVSWSLDSNNIHLIDKKLQEKIDDLEFKITQKLIQVEDYVKNNKCSYYNFKVNNELK